jgi:hypothetical protein
MLQMNCPRCNELIKTPILVELLDIECPQCRENVKVHNVVVSTKNFSMQRNDLIKRISHYKKLLKDVEKEVEHGENDQKSTENSRKSAANLRSSLKELLLAARDNFRLNISYDLYVQINFDSNERLARLVNISSTGACIELVDRGLLPGNNTEIKFQLLLPGDSEALSFPARVVWSRNLAKDTTSNNINMGVQFREIDEQARECIWNFIVDAETSAHT